jgi:excinuclease UvrABC ATPase subunit
MQFIKIRGAREHNLKGVDIDIPRDKLVVITGVGVPVGVGWGSFSRKPRAARSISERGGIL